MRRIVVHPQNRTPQAEAQPPPLLTVNDISTWLQVAGRTVRLWAETGEIPAHKVGRQWRFRLNAVQQWLTQRNRSE
ncbi:MAG: helix-turn-helix domain-containing protein [Bryobacterales bacterium]|nr:helix-turn-helix domain-containing protein [Bryobacterales bacterium]